MLRHLGLGRLQWVPSLPPTMLPSFYRDFLALRWTTLHIHFRTRRCSLCAVEGARHGVGGGGKKGYFFVRRLRRVFFLLLAVDLCLRKSLATPAPRPFFQPPLKETHKPPPSSSSVSQSLLAVLAFSLGTYLGGIFRASSQRLGNEVPEKKGKQEAGRQLTLKIPSLRNVRRGFGLGHRMRGPCPPPPPQPSHAGVRTHVHTHTRAHRVSAPLGPWPASPHVSVFEGHRRVDPEFEHALCCKEMRRLPGELI